MHISNIERIKELERMLDSSEGKRVYDWMFSLKKIEYTVNKNYDELYNAMDLHKKDMTILSMDNREKFDKFMFELSRLIHNYLASIFTLREFTYRFKDNLHNSIFKKEYEAKVPVFFNNQCSKFVQDLRTYTQHYQLPFLSSITNISTTDPKTNESKIKRGLCLSKAELLKWSSASREKKGWSPASRKYIATQRYSPFPKDVLEDSASQEDNLDLEKALEEHHHTLLIFYDLLEKRVQYLYCKEFKELERIRMEIYSHLFKPD